MQAVTQDFVHQLTWRMSTDGGKDGAIDYAAMFLTHLPGASKKVYFHNAVYWLTVAAGAGAFSAAFRASVVRSLPYLLLALLPIAWIVIFPNHSWIHGTFVTRLLFWPQLLGALALVAARRRETPA